MASEGLTVAAALLVAGPLLGLAGFYDTGLYRFWTASRDEQLALVSTHRRGWTMLNAGFTVATVLTASGLLLLAGSAAIADTPRAFLLAAAIGYAIAGVLWCAVLAIRARTTPTLASLAAAGAATEPTETVLGAAIGGLFASFCLLTSTALVVIGASLFVGGGVAAPIAGLVVVAGALCVIWFLTLGDLIPAVLYVPTLILGIALIVGRP